MLVSQEELASRRRELEANGRYSFPRTNALAGDPSRNRRPAREWSRHQVRGSLSAHCAIQSLPRDNH